MRDQAGGQDGPERPVVPSRRVRLVGRALRGAITAAPWSWPLIERPMRRFFDQRAPAWDERTNAPGHAHLAPLALALTKLPEAPERVLDIGTGTGVGALLIAREFPSASVRGVDLSERMIKLAQAKVGLDPEGRVAFRVADASKLPYEDERFDLITLLNMPPFFAEIARVTRPGGRVIVAASGGERTPFHTPDRVLERGFARHGLRPLDTGRIGDGTYFIAARDR